MRFYMRNPGSLGPTISLIGTSGYAFACETVCAIFSSTGEYDCAGLGSPEACMFLCDSSTERHVLLALLV